MAARAWCLVVAGCAWTPPGPIPRAVQTEPILEPLAPAIRIAVRDPVAAYNEPGVPGPPSELASATIAAMRVFTGGHGQIAGDPRLDRAAADLADAFPAADVDTDRLSALLLRARGVIEPAQRLWMVRDAADPVGELARRFDGTLAAENVRVGVGTARDRRTVAVIVVHSAAVALDPFPRSLPTNGARALRGTRPPQVPEAAVTITMPDGSVVHPAVDHVGDRFQTSVGCAGQDGELWVDITARGDPGRILAAFPITCGDMPPTVLVHEPAGNLAGLEDPARAARRIAAIVNRERIARGTAPLRADARLTAVARAHASELVRERRLSHRSRGGASFAERLRDAGIDPPRVSETVLAADDLGSAVAALLNDPAYRAGYAAELTHVGLGVARDPAGGVSVTLLYMGVAAPIETRAVADALAEGLRREGVRAGDRISVDPDLTRIASELANGLAVGWRRERLWPLARMQLETAGFGTYEIAVIAFYAPGELDPRRLLGAGETQAIGVGVAQSARDGYFAGKAWTAIVFARR